MLHATSDAIGSRRLRVGQPVDPALARRVPNVHDGLKGMRFIDAAVNSHENGGQWTTIIS
jgi:hypothetical protein